MIVRKMLAPIFAGVAVGTTFGALGGTLADLGGPNAAPPPVVAGLSAFMGLIFGHFIGALYTFKNPPRTYLAAIALSAALTAGLIRNDSQAQSAVTSAVPAVPRAPEPAL